MACSACDERDVERSRSHGYQVCADESLQVVWLLRFLAAIYMYIWRNKAVFACIVFVGEIEVVAILPLDECV